MGIGEKRLAGRNDPDSGEAYANCLQARVVGRYSCKLNLPLVPSQDYVLQDNKRYYVKMLSDWNFIPPSDVFWEA